MKAAAARGAYGKKSAPAITPGGREYRSRQMFRREDGKGEENGIETIVNHALKKKSRYLMLIWYLRYDPEE